MKMTIVLSLACAAFAAAGESVIVTTGNRAVIDVAEGEAVTQTDRVSVQDGGRLYKTGKGTLNLATATVLQSNPFRLGVRQGGVKVSAGGAAPDETADDLAALAVMSNAAFWVRADASAGLVLTNGNLVAQWRDVREGAVTDPSAPHAYPYAEPCWDSSLSDKPLYGTPPCLATAFGVDAVYFGGWKSSQKMWWYKADGSRCKMSGIRHAFIVQGVDKSYGFAVMGWGSDTADFHVGGTSGSISDPVWVSFADDGRAMRDASRTFLDGTLIDGPNTTVPSGRNFLLDVRFLNREAHAGSFFTDRDIKGRTGGDYLSEVLVFTTRLSDADCELVSRYLQKRHGLASVPQVAIDTAEGTTVECSVGAGQDFSSGLSVSGNGILLKSGSGTLVIPHQTESFGGGLRLQEGLVRLRDPLCYHVSGGEKVTVTADNTIDMNLTAAAGAADEFAKLGSGELRVSSIPATVKRVRVEAGELALTAPLSAQGLSGCSLTAGSGAPGTFANGDFSSMTNVYPDRGSVDVLSYSGTYGKLFDWVGYNNTDWVYPPQVMIVNWDKFDGGTNGKWPCGGVEPVQSRCFLAVKGDATAESTFTVAEAGSYVLKFHAQGRYSRGTTYHSPIAVQVGADADSLRTLGVVTACQEDKWHDYAYETGHLDPGTYVIRLATETTGKDNCTCFTDFALEQQPEADSAVAYRIPNGDCETRDLPFASSSSDLTTNVHLRGWTFDQGTFYDSYPGAARPAAFAYCNDTVMYNVALACSAVYGSNRFRIALASNKGAYAETTFTPPSGTYRLRGDVRCACCFWCSWYDGAWQSLNIRNTPKIEASVTVGGERTVLGSCTTSAQVDTQFVWGQSFTVDGTQPVTLRLESKASGGAALIDNLVLVREGQSVDHVTDGSFSGTGWECVSHKDASQVGLSYSTAERMRMYDTFNRNNWSTDLSSGGYSMRICQRGEIRQTVAFAKAGLYRLKFRAHSRPDGPNGGYGSGQNPIEAFLTKDGVTLPIGWQHVGNTNFIEHVMDFRVPAAGSYVLSLQGLCDGTAGHLWPSGKDQSTLLDDVSVVRLGEDVEDAADLPEGVTLSVAENARLRLDFIGTNKVKRLTLGGRRVTGAVSAATHPDFIQGPGTLEVERHGFYLICR